MTEDDKFWDEVCVWLGQRSVKEAFTEALKFEGENKQLKARIVQLEKFLRYTAETRHVDFTKMEALLDFRVCDSNGRTTTRDWCKLPHWYYGVPGSVPKV